MSTLPFRSLLASSVMLLTAGAYAGPLQFELGPPKDVEPGEIRKPSAEVTELWQGERKIFSAKSIAGRSVSSGDPAKATWIVSAITADGADEKKTPPKEIRHELWLITPDGNSRRLILPHVDATHPLISPDAATLAFTGCYDSSDPQRIFLCDIASGEVIMVSSDDGPRENYHAAARTWSADSRTLTFYQSWEPDGSAEVARSITLHSSAQPATLLKFEMGPVRIPERADNGEYPAEFTTYPAEPGEIRTLSSGIEELWQGDRKIFSARKIQTRSFSGSDPATGTWVVAAVTGNSIPIDDERANFTVRDGKEFLDASPSEIYLIAPDGASRRISLPGTHANGPVISPDGAIVAFASAPLFEDGAAGEMKLYLYDVVSSQITYAVANQTGWPDHGTTARWWSPDSRTLTFSDYREEGSGVPGALRTLTLLPKE